MVRPGTRDRDCIPFGKHKGMRVVDLPTQYLLFAVNTPQFKYQFPHLLILGMGELYKRMTKDFAAVVTDLHTIPPEMTMSKAERLKKNHEKHTSKKLRLLASQAGVADLL